MGETRRIDIDLSAETLEILRLRVESGEFASTAAAIEEAVRRLAEDTDRSERIHHLRQRIRKSLDDPRAPLSAKDAEQQISAFIAHHLRTV